MALYGTKQCDTCYGYGIKLTLDERKYIRECFMQQVAPTLLVNEDTIERCETCKGMGWRFIPWHGRIQLPVNTRKRW